MNITETWLTKAITNEADIEGYNMFRCDRTDNIKGGGVAIYVYNKLKIGQIWEKRHKRCEMIGVEIRDLQTINIVVYRPPDTKKEDFRVILRTLKTILSELGEHNNTIIISGDFNFRFIEWRKEQSGACSYRYKQTPRKDENDQFVELLRVCNEHCLIQIIDEPTRGENTLDLFFTNESNLITDVDINKSSKSDHSKIEISTKYIINNEKVKITNNQENINDVNFHDKTKWDIIRNTTTSKIETSILENSELITQIIDFIDIIHKVSLDELPRKKKNGDKKGCPKEIRKIKNRIKMLKRGKRNTKSKRKKKIIENKICDAEELLLKGLNKISRSKEMKAIAAIKDNPKIFYSIYNRRKNRKKELGPIKENDILVYDGKEIGDIFKNGYVSHFSKNNHTNSASPFETENEDDLNDINIEIQDIIDAIDKLDENSAPGPDGVPAIFLKKKKEVIAPHLTNMLRKSLDEGKIPQIFKNGLHISHSQRI